MSSLAPCICKCVMVSNLNQKSASQLGLRLWSVELASPTTHTRPPTSDPQDQIQQENPVCFTAPAAILAAGVNSAGQLQLPLTDWQPETDRLSNSPLRRTTPAPANKGSSRYTMVNAKSKICAVSAPCSRSVCLTWPDESQ